jgi:hypothetical protein
LWQRVHHDLEDEQLVQLLKAREEGLVEVEVRPAR